MPDIANDNSFKSFKSAQPTPNAANGILKTATTAVPLKCLTNFWRSLEMPLIH